MPELNVALLKEIRDWIAGGRQILVAGRNAHFNLADAFQSFDVKAEDGVGFCQTVCCIAGAAVALDTPRLATEGLKSDQVDEVLAKTADGYILDRGQDILGLDDRRAVLLFNPEAVIDENHERIVTESDRFALEEGLGEDFENGDVTSDWAVVVIDKLIETGEVDWVGCKPAEIA